MNVWTIFLRRIRSNYEQKTEKASIWAASFLPSKVNYDRNFLLLMNLGKTNCNTAVFSGFSEIVKSLFWNHIWNGGKLTLSSVLKTRIKYWKLYWNIGCDTPLLKENLLVFKNNTIMRLLTTQKDKSSWKEGKGNKLNENYSSLLFLDYPNLLQRLVTPGPEEWKPS